MKIQKTLIIITCILLLLLSGVLICTSNKLISEKSEPWTLYSDYVHGWQISYPPEVTEIQLVQDMGPQDDILNNILFASTGTGQWIFSIAVSNTTIEDIDTLKDNPGSYLTFEKSIMVQDTNAIVSIDKERPGNTYISFIKYHKLFNIHTNTDVDYEKILRGFNFI